MAGLDSFTLSANGETGGVRPDGTTQTNLSDGSYCATDCTVTGTSRAGNNLFHSFSEFSVPESITVTFLDQGAQNIFARVSSRPSLINGTIAVSGMGNANLFLINPYGITFGPSAALVSTGSFAASTADSIVFPDNVQFSATENASPMLTVSAPIGLRFGQSPGPIMNQSQSFAGGSNTEVSQPAGLQVSNGKTLALIGGPVSLDGGYLTAASGNIEIGSVAANSKVSITPKLTFQYENISFQDILLTQRSVVNASGDGGSIHLRGNNIEILGLSGVINTNLGSASTGILKFTASGTIDIDRSVVVFSGSIGNGTELEIDTKKLVVRDGSIISGGTFGSSQGSTVTINATEAVEVIGTNGSFPTLITTSTEGTGAGGNLTINTRRISVKDGAQLQAVTYGPGTGGNLTINATEQVSVTGTGETIFSSQSASGVLASSGLAELPFQPTGKGGNLTINTGVLSIDQGGRVAVNSLGTGDSGSLNVEARAVRLDNNSQITAAAAFGNGGNVRLNNLETLILRRGGTVSAQAGSAGLGNGGNIVINADFIVAKPMENSDIVARAISGQGGNISISTRGLYGLEQRRAIANNTNDIDASSDFGVSGTIGINQITAQAEQDNRELPQQPLETSTLLSQGCGASGNRLVITGRGGMPAAPTDTPGLNIPLADLGESYAQSRATSTSDINSSNRSSVAASAGAEHSQNFGWVEATGWKIDDNQQVILVAPSAIAEPLQAAAHCTG
ncbi:MAG: filamentous hemagglutinin N-terminal domain-containing protein [Phormidesmis sp.]